MVIFGDNIIFSCLIVFLLLDTTTTTTTTAQSPPCISLRTAFGRIGRGGVQRTVLSSFYVSVCTSSVIINSISATAKILLVDSHTVPNRKFEVTRKVIVTFLAWLASSYYSSTVQQVLL